MSDWSQLKATNYHREYYEEHKAAGLDYLVCGEWQESYGRWLVESLGWQGKDVLDVGCACGAIAEGLRRAGAKSHGVDLNNHTVRLGQSRFRSVPLYVCDAVNLHLFGDASFDGIHCAQVAEHWKPELVPFIFAELARVLKPGGLMFLCLDTVELFARQGRSGNGEDPTHVCVRPRLWWAERLEAAGFTDPGGAAMLMSHPGNFFARHDWEWFLCAKK